MNVTFGVHQLEFVSGDFKTALAKIYIRKKLCLKVEKRI